jgi:hypothetical protein
VGARRPPKVKEVTGFTFSAVPHGLRFFSDNQNEIRLGVWFGN